MTLTTFATIAIVGIISGNAIVSSFAGVDLVATGINNIKQSLIFSLAIFAMMLVSSVLVYLLNLILVATGFGGLLLPASLILISIVVQMADFLLEKLCPITYTKVKEIMIVLIPTLTVIVLSLFVGAVSFVKLFLNVIFSGVGITLILVCVAGVRQNKLTYSSYDIFKGNLITMVVLFVLTLIWTAF